MATKYYAVLTNVGAAKLANATALGVQVEITQMAVGDGNSALPTPNQAQTALVHELRRAPLNTLSIDPNNANQIIAEQVIPEDVGGWWIREIGLFDKDGDMIAVANCAETYKPQLQEGSGRVQVVRMILIVSSTAAVTLKIDPSVVLATRQYVDDQIIQVKAFVDQQLAAHIAAADPHKKYAPKASPDLTGTPTAPTAAQSVNNTQIATTAFVKSAIAGMVGSAPAALDTLNELAAALGNDPNFATTMLNALAGKQPLDNTLTNLSGKDVAGLLTYLGLGEGSALPVGVPIPWPQATPPEGWIKCNGATFDKAKYPKLAAAYPSGTLPDLRGYFIRGWDDSRGVDSGRAINTGQGPRVGYLGFSLSTFAGAFSPGSIILSDAVNVTCQNINGAAGSINNDNGAASGDAYVIPADTRPWNVAFNYIVRAA